jgi:hypothetical protein
MVVHCFIPTIYFSTVSPSPLTAEAPHQSPSGSKPYGSRKPGVTNRYISLRFISISISHSVKRSQKPMNMSTTNDYESRNSPTERTTLAVAIKVKLETITSSPTPTPRALRDSSRATVPLLTARALPTACPPMVVNCRWHAFVLGCFAS